MIAVVRRSGTASRSRALAVFGLLAALVVLLAFVHLGIGASAVNPATLLDVLFRFDPANFEHNVLANLRLPRLFAAVLCGSCLGMSGLLLQSLLRNPLAEPHILGLNAGASLAVVICSALPAAIAPEGLARPLVAALGGGLVFSLVFALASVGRLGLTPTKLTFCGIAISALASALISAILILDQDTLEEMRLWLAGDLAGMTRSSLAAAMPVVAVAIFAAIAIVPRLDALALGDTAATGLGVPVRSTRIIGLAATALLCGACVSIAGPIGFVGLIVPGIAHRLSGGRHLLSLALAGICGAALLLSADIIARVLLAPREIATGIMTAFVGAPAYLLLVARTVK